MAPAQESNDSQITTFLNDWSKQDSQALMKLFPLVLEDLRKLANSQFRKERQQHTLQPTALVNECYLRMLNADPVACNDREHFFALAARIMRRILVDHARHRNRAKRPGSVEQETIELDILPTQACTMTNIVALDVAIAELWELEPTTAKVTELRLFAGLTFEEIGTILNITERTARRKWSSAKRFLFKALEP